ncbi:MAG: hypothetical protein QW128_00520 [Thermoprotei archaeon]
MAIKMWWHGYWHHGPWYYHKHYLTAEEELEILKDYKKHLELELQYINEKIAELEKELRKQ